MFLVRNTRKWNLWLDWCFFLLLFHLLLCQEVALKFYHVVAHQDTGSQNLTTQWLVSAVWRWSQRLVTENGTTARSDQRTLTGSFHCVTYTWCSWYIMHSQLKQGEKPFNNRNVMYKEVCSKRDLFHSFSSCPPMSIDFSIFKSSIDGGKHL